MKLNQLAFWRREQIEEEDTAPYLSLLEQQVVNAATNKHSDLIKQHPEFREVPYTDALLGNNPDGHERFHELQHIAQTIHPLIVRHIIPRYIGREREIADYFTMKRQIILLFGMSIFSEATGEVYKELFEESYVPRGKS